MAHGKRTIDVIELSDSDDAPFNSQPRKIPRSLSANQDTPSQSDPWDREDEEDADDIIILSQDDSNRAGESFELYGVLHTKIVGIQYYKGHATDGEFVIIRREPSNRFDKNAIRVDNVRRDQIGHIPRTVAAKLSDYMVINQSIYAVGC